MLSLQLINWFVANPILPRPEQLISFIPQPFPAEQKLRGLFLCKKAFRRFSETLFALSFFYSALERMISGTSVTPSQ